MTPIAQVLRALWRTLKAEWVLPDPSESEPITPIPGDTHSRKVPPFIPFRAHSPFVDQRTEYRLYWASLTAQYGRFDLAADWLIAASSRDGIPRVTP